MTRPLVTPALDVPAEHTSVDATFAFVDLAGFTALTETHGDAEAVATVRAFQGRVREALGPGDELVKTIGDSVMLKFDNPRRAVTALRELIDAELSTAAAVLMPRVGAHHGTAVAVEGDYYGAGVNLAARVAAEATAGQLLVTEETAIAAADLGAAVSHVGAITLRNVSEPVDIYDVRVGATSEQAAIDPVCHMRDPADGSGATLHWQDRDVWFCGLPCVARFAADPERYA
jgi:adenylate cyclase